MDPVDPDSDPDPQHCEEYFYTVPKGSNLFSFNLLIFTVHKWVFNITVHCKANSFFKFKVTGTFKKGL